MGAGASLVSLTKEDIANYVRSVPKIEKCADLLLENEVDGTMLLGIRDEEVAAFLDEIGITSPMLRSKLTGELIKIKHHLSSGNTAKEEGVVAQPQHENKFETQYMVFGDDEDFKYGLTKKIAYLDRSIEEECCENEGGKWKSHYDYVVKEAAFELVEDPNNPHRVRDKGHAGMTLESFMNHEMAVEAKLTSAEVAVLRLYTGPIYVPWNTALRRYKTDPTLISTWSTCISVLYSAIFKLSYLSKKGTVYRGVNESSWKLPDHFVDSTNDNDFASGVELAFMSTSLDMAVAGEYARRGTDPSSCTIFEIKFDAASRGASVKWVSQFPYEDELLYPPCTYLTCESSRVLEDPEFKGIRCLSVRATVSTAQPNVEDIKTVQDRQHGAAARKKNSEKNSKISGLSEERREKLEEMQLMGLPLSQYIKEGITPAELRSMMTEDGFLFTIKDMLAAGCDGKELYDAGFDLVEIAAAGWHPDNEATWHDLYNSGCSVEQLRQAGCFGFVLRRAGVKVSELQKAGYAKHDIFSAQEMKEKGIDPATMGGMGYTLLQIRSAFPGIKTEWKEVCTWTGHTGGVHALLQLSDGRVVSGSGDNTIKIWDLTSGTCLSTWTGQTSSVYALLQLSDGRVVSSSHDKTIKVWDLTSGSCLSTWTGHTNQVLSLLQLSDGRVVSVSGDRTIKVWDLTSGSCLSRLIGHNNAVLALLQLSDGRVLSSSHDYTIKIWEEKLY